MIAQAASCQRALRHGADRISGTSDRPHQRTRQEAVDRNDPASWPAYGEAAYQNGRFADAVRAFEQGLALGSAEGVFTLRSSYPQALRALGREQDATRARHQVNGLTAVPSTFAPAPDPFAVQRAAERSRIEPGQRFTE